MTSQANPRHLTTRPDRTEPNTRSGVVIYMRTVLKRSRSWRNVDRAGLSSVVQPSVASMYVTSLVGKVGKVSMPITSMPAK
jgi:hypothetical protein